MRSQIRRSHLLRLAQILILAMCGSAVLVTAAADASFCRSPVSDYRAPLTKLPEVRNFGPVAPGNEIPLGLGTSGIWLRQVSPTNEDFALLTVGYGKPWRAGYELVADTDRGPTRVDWEVAARLHRVKKGGGHTIGQRIRRLHSIRDQTTNRFLFIIPQVPGYYLVDIEVREWPGRRLRRFGQYVRVVPRRQQIHLLVNDDHVSVGDRIKACLQNYGTTIPFYRPAASGLEYFDGGGWVPSTFAPPSTGVFLEMGLSAGMAEILGTITIPAGAPPGRYRWLWQSRSGELQRSAEFTVSG